MSWGNPQQKSWDISATAICHSLSLSQMNELTGNMGRSTSWNQDCREKYQ